MSNTYYKALDQPNADVVTEPIAEVGPAVDHHGGRHDAARST